jgi:hypothetical protein
MPPPSDDTLDGEAYNKLIGSGAAGLGGIGLFDPGTGMLGAAALLGDGDNGEILSLEAVR